MTPIPLAKEAEQAITVQQNFWERSSTAGEIRNVRNFRMEKVGEEPAAIGNCVK